MSFGGGAGGAGSGTGEVSLGEHRSAGELSVRVRRAAGWREDGEEDAAGEGSAVSGRTASIGEGFGGLENSTPFRREAGGTVIVVAVAIATATAGAGGGGGVVGESRASISKSEILLARRPRPLGGRISGEGGDGDLLGERGHGTVEICWIADVCAEVEVELEVVR